MGSRQVDARLGGTGGTGGPSLPRVLQSDATEKLAHK